MFERLLFAAGLIVLGIAVWSVVNRLSIRRLAARASDDPLLSDLRTGVPAIVYFTTPFCVPCRTLQRPALDELEAELGLSIQVVQVDASEQPDVADRWGVFSAPTTFILDGEHRPRQVNRGVATVDRLKQQVKAITVPSAELVAQKE
jgi:thiol-disulfide isomerase/thioredoxin